MLGLRSIDAVNVPKVGGIETLLLVATFEHAGRVIVKDIALLKGVHTWNDCAYWLMKAFYEAWRDVQFLRHGEGWRAIEGTRLTPELLRSMAVALQKKQPKRLLRKFLNGA